MKAFLISSVAYGRRLMSKPSPLFSSALRIPSSVQNVAFHTSGEWAMSKRMSELLFSTLAPCTSLRSARIRTQNGNPSRCKYRAHGSLLARPVVHLKTCCTLFHGGWQRHKMLLGRESTYRSKEV